MAQAARLLNQFTWDKEKLQVLEAVGSRLRDGHNAYKLIEYFTFSDAKDKARRILGLSR